MFATRLIWNCWWTVDRCDQWFSTLPLFYLQLRHETCAYRGGRRGFQQVTRIDHATSTPRPVSQERRGEVRWGEVRHDHNSQSTTWDLQTHPDIPASRGIIIKYWFCQECCSITRKSKFIVTSYRTHLSLGWLTTKVWYPFHYMYRLLEALNKCQVRDVVS